MIRSASRSCSSPRSPPLPVAAQEVHLAVIVGLAGEPEHRELFQRWASTLVDTASGRLGVPRDHIVYLAEQPEQDAKRATGKSTKQEIDAAFGRLAKPRKRTTWCSSC